MFDGPSVPAAPARFSITIDWPRCFSVAVASARSAMSVEPPGGHGTISVTGRVGNCCALALAANAMSAAAVRNSLLIVCPVFETLNALVRKGGQSVAERRVPTFFRFGESAWA